MDADRFDHFSRSLTNIPSRRSILGVALAGVIGSLLNLTDAGAKKKHKKKKCKRGKKKCGKRCIPKTDCCSDANCGPFKLCVDGVCVVGQGTCPDSAIGCPGPAISCGPQSLSCFCSQNTSGEVRCGTNGILGLDPCGACVNDIDCAQLYPDVPGVFCATGGGTCYCVNNAFCQAPCPI